MKNFLIILGLLITLAGFGQSKPYPVLDSINGGGVTGTDTVYFIQFYNDEIASIEFDYTDLNADDATIDIGYSNFGNTHNTSDTDVFPFTLDVTTNKVSINGTDKASLVVLKNQWNVKYLTIRYVKGTVTCGWIPYKFVK